MQEGLVLNGRFRLVAELGRGGMGSVWRAEDMTLEAQAAVKLIDPSLLQTPEALARFKREAKAAAAIRSTHVVQILDYGVQQTEDGEPLPYIAMELLKGESLAKRLEHVQRLTPEDTVQILTHVARALSLAHAAGIVHRDLKPDNVFLVREMDEDVGKVLDFGVARQLGALNQTGGLQTQSGAVLGTPYYMSPEQTVGQAVDARSDIWSFGVIAFECLTGVRPFDQETLGGLFHAICVAAIPVPSTKATVPDGFDQWFARATARDLNERFQTVEEAISQLRKCCSRATGRSLSTGSLMRSGTSGPSVVDARSTKFAHTPPPAAQTIPGLAPKRRWLWLAIGLPALAVASIGGYVGWRSMRPGGATPDDAHEPLAVESSPPAAAASPAPAVIPAVAPIATERPTAAAIVSAAPSAALTKPIIAVAPRTIKPSIKSAGEKSAAQATLKPAQEVAESKPASPAAAPSVKKRENVAGF